jgi:hypothetical protein
MTSPCHDMLVTLRVNHLPELSAQPTCNTARHALFLQHYVCHTDNRHGPCLIDSWYISKAYLGNSQKLTNNNESVCAYNDSNGGLFTHTVRCLQHTCTGLCLPGSDIDLAVVGYVPAGSNTAWALQDYKRTWPWNHGTSMVSQY